MGQTIQNVQVIDLRFPTSMQLDGSDAMNAAPDYSAAYVTLTLSDGSAGNGLSFTIGRGNEIVVAAVESLKPLVIGRDFRDVRENMGAFWRALTGDSQLRWIGPDKGAIHLATAAVVNAVWDLWAKLEGKPVWCLLADLEAEQLVACLDFRFVADHLTRDEALAMLRKMERGKAERVDYLQVHGYPAYTTGAGWLGYSEEKIRRLAKAALDDGFEAFKQKVGANLADDIERGHILRDVIGSDRLLMLDANQVWEVDEAISAMHRLRELSPYWIEEPTSPDDVLGHQRIRQAVAPIRVATGEHCQNRILFKQFLSSGAMDVCQVDVARVGGLNEAIIVMLLAAKYGIPVCPHGGGVGLCEYIQHLSFFDFVCLSGSLEGRFIEHVAHLHEHFLDPIQMKRGRFQTPQSPGFSIEIKTSTLKEFVFPHGLAWSVETNAIGRSC
jgi:L-fuconate dehydratase